MPLKPLALSTYRLVALSCAPLLLSCSSPAKIPTDPLITGHALSPPASFAQAIGSLPVNLAISPNGQFAVTTDAGYRQSLHVIRLSDGRSLSHLNYPNKAGASRIGEDINNPIVKTNGLYYGLAIAKDNTLFAAQGANDTIAILALSKTGQLTPLDAIKTRPMDFPAGLAIDDRQLLYVANQASSSEVTNPLAASGSVAIYDSLRKQVGRYTFTDSHLGTTNYPLAIAVLPDGSKTYVASERDDCVYILDTKNPAHPKLSTKLGTGALPTALLFSRDHARLFVANADSDTVSIIDTHTDTIAQTIPLRPDIARTLPGATPIALCLSPDEATLYVAMGDMNAVAVVDVPSTSASPSLRGYFPTGWYPSALTVTHDGKSILVLNAKGIATRNPNVPHQSPLNILEGNAQLIPIPSYSPGFTRGVPSPARESTNTPDESPYPDLQHATAQVLKNNHYDRLSQPLPQPLASLTKKSGKITHVIYIIKENRTYDQVLGDIPQGNGDAALCLFPRNITPNQHALADRFTLLDNLYACGEVSGDGWNWSTQSMANPYVIRNIPYNYSNRGRKFDFEGMNNGYPTAGVPALGPDGKPAAANPAFKNGAPAIPDVAEAPGGHLWDLCASHNLTFRNYGCYSVTEGKGSSVPGSPQNYPASIGLTPGGHNLHGKTDIDFRRFDLDYADSDASSILAEKNRDKNFLYATPTYGKYNSPSRFSEWNREFKLMLEKDPSGKTVPALMMLRVPDDHTIGTKSGKHSPASCVADNDFCVGQIVEAVSHSAIWEHTAIFVIEDDAQSGPDHVDCHRTTGFVISPYMGAPNTGAPNTAPHKTADHRFYNTNSFLRTIEILLDLPPMTQYDATATLISGWTPTPANNAPYTPIMPDEKIFAQINPKAAAAANPEAQRLANASDQMDFSIEDAAPALLLNEIIWKSVRGLDSKMPQPKTSKLLPTGQGKKDGDDDDD